MKNALIAFGLGIVIILCVIIHSVLTTKDATENDLYHTLDKAVEDTLQTMTFKPFHTMEDIDDIINDLGNGIKEQLSGNVDLVIELKESNYLNGELALNIIGKFTEPNGKVSEAKIEKIINAERYIQEQTTIVEGE